MSNSATQTLLLPAVERLVVASVGVTARALAETAPDLTFLQWRVLVLIDQPEGIAVGAIANALSAKIAAVSRLIGRLRARGLVQTQRSELDARVVLVSLTDEGLALKQLVQERRRTELAAALKAAQVGIEDAAAIDRLAELVEPIA